MQSLDGKYPLKSNVKIMMCHHLLTWKPWNSRYNTVSLNPSTVPTPESVHHVHDLNLFFSTKRITETLKIFRVCWIFREGCQPSEIHNFTVPRRNQIRCGTCKLILLNFHAAVKINIQIESYLTWIYMGTVRNSLKEFRKQNSRNVLKIKNKNADCSPTENNIDKDNSL